jgi:hypothetical protein
MTVVLIIIHLYGGAITEQPTRSMEHCEATAKAYNQNLNFRGRAIAYCASCRAAPR